MRSAFLAILVPVILAGCGGREPAVTGAQPPASSASGVVARFDIEQFGADGDKNGVPDRLDEYVADLDKNPETKAAAIDYYRTASYLSAKALAGEHLTEDEKKSIFDGVLCIQLLDPSEPVLLPENAFMSTPSGFNGMNALEDELSGTAYSIGGLSKEDCSARIRR